MTDTTTLQNAPVAQESTAPADDFFSDAPLSVCPMRKDGMGPDETCEACQ